MSALQLPFTVRDLTRIVDDGRRRERDLERVTVAAWHRLSFAGDRPTDRYPDVRPIPDEQLDGMLLAARFRDDRPRRPGAYTGGQLPYHLVIRTDGVVDQLVELGDTAMHATRWNSAAVGIAVVGDFRRHSPTPAQWETAAALCAILTAWGIERHEGHSDLDGGSADPSKVCPGPHFDLDRLWDQAQTHSALALGSRDAELTMVAAGIVV